MIPLLRLFETVQIGVEILLRSPRRPVDPLQLLTILITAPIGTRGSENLECRNATGPRACAGPDTGR